MNVPVAAVIKGTCKTCKREEIEIFYFPDAVTIIGPDGEKKTIWTEYLLGVSEIAPEFCANMECFQKIFGDRERLILEFKKA